MEFRCIKCGHGDPKVVYTGEMDVLNCECRRCGYKWEQDPMDRELNETED